MAWTRFMDMHSGGRLKEHPYSYIFIEAPQKEAVTIFYNRFGHNPYRVTCTCCGEDYSIQEEESLEQATAFERNCQFDESQNKWVESYDPSSSLKYLTLDEYLRSNKVLVIYAKDIKDEERAGEVPEQGYVWKD